MDYFQYISDQKLEDPSMLFREGQSVIVKIIEVNNEKKRFLLSLRLSDCYHGNIENGLELLSSYLEEYNEMKQHLQSKKGEVYVLSVLLCECSLV